MRVVLDTNVLVSGLLSPYGAPGEVVQLAASGISELCYDGRILAEYREVLSRPKFGFDPEEVSVLLEQIKTGGRLVAPMPLAKALPDSEDEAFLEIALAAGAQALVTGNIRHYPPDKRQGMRVLEPRAFLGLFRDAA